MRRRRIKKKGTKSIVYYGTYKCTAGLPLIYSKNVQNYHSRLYRFSGHLNKIPALACLCTILSATANKKKTESGVEPGFV